MGAALPAFVSGGAAVGFSSANLAWLRQFNNALKALADRRKWRTERVFLVAALLALVACIGVSRAAADGHHAPGQYAVFTNAQSARITAGILERALSLGQGNVATTNLLIDGHACLGGAARELSFAVAFAQPNQRPRGLMPDGVATVETRADFAPGNDELRVTGDEHKAPAGVAWVQGIALNANAWAEHFRPATCRLAPGAEGVSRRLVVTARAAAASALAGLQVDLNYEIYDGFPVIRKWVEISNAGTRWLKLNDLVIDDLELAADCRHQTPLTPGERGAGPSVIAFGTEDGRRGVIAVSEIPSALRHTRETGAMGYAAADFEWVLGPGEKFVSEAVFLLAYSGQVEPTIAGISTPRDRTVEGPYLEFLRAHVGVAADQAPIDAPQWCSWSNFGWAINDATMRAQAEIAARCGFVLMLLDSGWQKDTIGTDADPRKFPDFAATCNHIRSLGLKLGLWVSCFRTVDSPDLRALPDARSLPLIKRDGGFGMSFASPWKRFYAEDLARISKKYGVTYFKQDYTDIKFGDLAEGHESRTRQESLLRGLRGLLAAQDLLREAAPQVTAQITHEIYWGTPGVPCDVAVLKHAARYHIPPNDYAGVGHAKQRAGANWSYDPAKLRQELIAGCLNARRRFYAHRGLPLYTLEYYGAHTVNFRGSLTPEVQDRQVCSWLMGAPSVFAGDLASLTEENIKRYRQRFEVLARLQATYDIYRHFQYSGVPEPTDQDWHWWGKLNPDGCGAVVVLRGAQGDEERAVNVPWVAPSRTYEVHALFAERSLGRFTGQQLQAGALALKLAPFGQEILELKAAAAP